MKWIGAIEQRRIELRNSNYSYSKIAKILSNEFNLNITRDMVSSRCRKYRLKNDLNNNLNNVLFNDKKQLSKSDKSNKLFDERFYDLKDDFIGCERVKKQLKDIWEMFNDNKPKKILSLSDLHAPYMNFKALEKILLDNEDCNICILNGDIYDGESMSVFDKMDEIDSSEEFTQVFELLDVITKRFEHIIWVGGNHDFQRFCKYIIKNIKPGLRKFAFDRLNPMTYIASKYDNVITICHNFVEIGDTIFKHPNGYSNGELKTVINELEIANANKKDLPNPNFRALIIGHTHYAGKYFKNNQLAMEQGCICFTPDYRYNNPVKKQWTTAYARIEMDSKNRIIFNNSDVFILD